MCVGLSSTHWAPFLAYDGSDSELQLKTYANENKALSPVKSNFTCSCL